MDLFALFNIFAEVLAVAPTNLRLPLSNDHCRNSSAGVDVYHHAFRFSCTLQVLPSAPLYSNLWNGSRRGLDLGPTLSSWESMGSRDALLSALFKLYIPAVPSCSYKACHAASSYSFSGPISVSLRASIPTCSPGRCWWQRYYGGHTASRIPGIKADIREETLVRRSGVSSWALEVSKSIAQKMSKSLR